MAENGTDTGKKKKAELDMITLNMSKNSGRKDDAIELPGRTRRSVADMTRMTSGGDRIAPKNSVLDAKEILVSTKGRPRDGQFTDDRAHVTTMPRPHDGMSTDSKAHVTTMPKPHDRIIDSDSLLMTPAPRRTSEGIINGESVSVKSKGARPHELLDDSGVVAKGGTSQAKDLSFSQVERKLKAGLPRPRETDPGPSRLTRKSQKKVEAEEKEEEPKNDAPPSDDSIYWFS